MSAAAVSGIVNLNGHVVNFKGYDQTLPVVYAQNCYVYPDECNTSPSQGYNPDPTLNPGTVPNQDDDPLPSQGQGGSSQQCPDDDPTCLQQQLRHKSWHGYKKVCNYHKCYRIPY